MLPALQHNSNPPQPYPFRGNDTPHSLNPSPSMSSHKHVRDSGEISGMLGVGLPQKPLALVLTIRQPEAGVDFSFTLSPQA